MPDPKPAEERAEMPARNVPAGFAGPNRQNVDVKPDQWVDEGGGPDGGGAPASPWAGAVWADILRNGGRTEVTVGGVGRLERGDDLEKAFGDFYPPPPPPPPAMVERAGERRVVGIPRAWLKYPPRNLPFLLGLENGEDAKGAKGAKGAGKGAGAEGAKGAGKDAGAQEAQGAKRAKKGVGAEGAKGADGGGGGKGGRGAVPDPESRPPGNPPPDPETPPGGGPGQPKKPKARRKAGQGS
jgi:hypothetical protein